MAEEKIKSLRVTAAITTYHRSWEMLQRAIRSVLAQTVPVEELLLIDDNGQGTPEQAAIAKGVVESGLPKLRYIPLEHNSGVAAARNRAIAEAKGDVLGYLDDDDEWCPDKLEKLLPLFEAEERPALVFGTGWVLPADETKAHYNWQWEVFLPQPGYADMLYTDYVGSASAPLLRLDALRQVGGFRTEEQPAAEDYELWVRVAQQFLLRGIRDVVFHKHDETAEHVSGSLRRVGNGFRSIYKLYRADYEQNPRAKTAMLWNICRTGVRGLDVTVTPYVFAWLGSRWKERNEKRRDRDAAYSGTAE